LPALCIRFFAGADKSLQNFIAAFSKKLKLNFCDEKVSRHPITNYKKAIMLNGATKNFKKLQFLKNYTNLSISKIIQ